MKGFTLVEMLVALFVFALLTVAGATVLRSTADSRETTHKRTETLAAFQRVRAILKSDLSQAAARRTRDASGRTIREAFSGANPGSGGPLLRFVRRGWENTDLEARASLQQVEYRLTEGRLERIARLALDGGASGPPQILVEHIRSAEIAFLWRGQWIGTLPGGPDNPLPQAVRLDMRFDGIGAVRQIFAVSGESL
jgi:general secretion pathway protein J